MAKKQTRKTKRAYKTKLPDKVDPFIIPKEAPKMDAIKESTTVTPILKRTTFLQCLYNWFIN